MPCYHPLSAYQPTCGGSILFSTPRDKRQYHPIKIPCSKCIGCRLEYSRQWAVRMMHEASLHEDNCFVTLTYSPENMPSDGSLHLSHFQDFVKRLRSRTGVPGIKYFHCGEYGDTFGRPHYHANFFGYDFPDKYHWRTSDRGDLLYRSDLLESLWTFGSSEIGAVTFESAAYVARYVCKKLNISSRSPQAAVAAYNDKYERYHLDTGEVFYLQPEYATMSRRPGIGKGWFDKFLSDLYPDDFVISNGHKAKIPRYYDTQLQRLCPDEFLLIKEKRELDNLGFDPNTTSDRLAIREECLRSRIKQLTRGVD